MLASITQHGVRCLNRSIVKRASRFAQKSVNAKTNIEAATLVPLFQQQNRSYSRINNTYKYNYQYQHKHISISSSLQLNRNVSRGYATEPFKLADIGEGIAQVEILQWFVKTGDVVEEFDRICEVQSDKATVEIKSPKNAKITKLYYAIGDMAKVGAPLVDFESSGAAAAAPAATSAAHAPKSASSSTTSTTQTSSSAFQSSHPHTLDHNIIVSGKKIKILAAPSVRHLAFQHKINLSSIQGSGKDGRVTKGDLLGVINGTTPLAPTPQAAATITTTSASPSAGDRVEKLKGYNRAMVKKMAESLTIPHFGYCDEIYFDSLIKIRSEMKSLAEKRGIKLSYMPFIIKACSLGLKQYPILNSSLSKDLTEVIYHGSHNIGVAVDTPGGLVVPNIKNVQDLTLFEIAAELHRIIEAARINKLPPHDLSGGTFSLSNIGAIGGTYAKPVLVVPEVCIGAIGKVQTLPRFDPKGNIYAANIVQFSWSADHRIIDGATMANFSNLLKQYLENPTSMLMDTK